MITYKNNASTSSALSFRDMTHCNKPTFFTKNFITMQKNIKQIPKKKNEIKAKL